MSLYFDVTKTVSAKQLSGLVRVSEKLRQSLKDQLGDGLVPVVWNSRKRQFLDLNKRQVECQKGDSFLSPEVFSSDERPGYYGYLRTSPAKTAAIFHDAIPLNYPEITWKQSVARHPQYMEDLAGMDHVFSVSQASLNELHSFWKDRSLNDLPSSSVITLGADFVESSTVNRERSVDAAPLVLNVGIVEPRKNQSQLLSVVKRLWDAGLEFEMHFVGRVNPQFGKPIAKDIKRAGREGYPVFLHRKQSDGLVTDLYSKAAFTVFNSMVEGFGLPVVESLWLGVPCISKRLPSLESLNLHEGCLFVDTEEQLERAIAEWLQSPEALRRAADAANELSLPLWKNTAEEIRAWL